jgi:hypothetical protein
MIWRGYPERWSAHINDFSHCLWHSIFAGYRIYVSAVLHMVHAFYDMFVCLQDIPGLSARLQSVLSAVMVFGYCCFPGSG